MRIDSSSKQMLTMCRGAAQATDCRLEIKLTETMYDIRQNNVLIEEYKNITQNHYGMGLNSMEGAIGGSTDFVSASINLELNSPTLVGQRNISYVYTAACNSSLTELR